MAITIKEPRVYTDVDFELEFSHAQLLSRIKNKSCLIDAIVVLRIINPNIGLKQAKEFVDTLK